MARIRILPERKATVTMAAPAEIDTSRLACQDVYTTSKGAKTIPLAYKDGTAVLWQPRQPLAVFWEPSAYNDETATRLNISFAPNPEVEKELQAFDAWCVDTLVAESVRLFGNTATRDEAQRGYQPALRVSEKTGATSLRCKMNTVGRNAVKCWDTFRAPRSLPESWTTCAVTPRIALKGLWVMGKEIGPLLELQHAMLDEATAECPF